MKGVGRPKRNWTTERGSEKEAKNPKLSMTFIHGRFHHFPRHHLSWWPLHCCTLHNTLIESMSTNLYAFYRFAIHFIVHNRGWALTARPAHAHSPFSSGLLFYATRQTRCVSFSPPIRFIQSKAISIWSAACLNCMHRVHKLVPIDICVFERYNCEWQYEFIVTVCLYRPAPMVDVLPRFWFPKKC